MVTGLKKLIEDNGLADRVDLGGAFCMGQCQKGVCVMVDDVVHSVTPETVEAFFNDHVKGKA